MADNTQKTVRQHYVPRMYLRNFVANSKTEQIYAYNKIDKKTIYTSINNVAQETYFYDFPLDQSKPEEPYQYEKDEQLVEKTFADIENDMAPLIRRLKTKFSMTNRAHLDSVVIFTEEERARFSIFIILQLMRTKTMRKVFTELREKATIAYARQKLPSGALRGLKISLSNTSHALNHAGFIFDEDLLLKLAEIISQDLWFVGINHSDMPFYTSDHPVVMYNHEMGQIVMGGLGKTGLELVLPLTSELILIVREPSHSIQFSYLDNHFVKLQPEATKEYNTWQVIMSERMVFCKEGSFELAKRIAQDLPQRKNHLLDINKINRKAKEFFKNDHDS